MQHRLMLDSGYSTDSSQLLVTQLCLRIPFIKRILKPLYILFAKKSSLDETYNECRHKKIARDQVKQKMLWISFNLENRANSIS